MRFPEAAVLIDHTVWEMSIVEVCGVLADEEPGSVILLISLNLSDQMTPSCGLLDGLKYNEPSSVIVALAYPGAP
jgi:hypothetical protein